MPKQFINVLGILICIAVIAAGFFLVALPLVLQAVTVQATTTQTVATNDTYQLQVDSLHEQEARSEEIAQSVGGLRAQIPANPGLDDVFEIVANAAASAGVTVASITAGEQSVFVERTSPTAVGEETEAAPTETTDGSTATPAPTATPAAETGGPATDGTSELTGRTQVDFAISVTSDSVDKITAFLDALRSGPRLLSNITSTVNRDGSVFSVQVSALTYVDEGVSP